MDHVSSGLRHVESASDLVRLHQAEIRHQARRYPGRLRPVRPRRRV